MKVSHVFLNPAICFGEVLLNRLNVVSYEKFLDIEKEIEKEKKAYFIGSCVFLFTSILFIFQIKGKNINDKKINERLKIVKNN